MTSHLNLQASPKHRSTTALLILVTWKYYPSFPDSWKHLDGVTLPAHGVQIRQKDGVCFQALWAAFLRCQSLFSSLPLGRTQDDGLDEAMQSQQLSAHLEMYMETKYSLSGNETVILHALLGS